MSIDAKREETLKLREYIIMEQEKLEEGKRVFQEDQEKFHQYMNEIEAQTEKAIEQTEKSVKHRWDLTENAEKLQHEILLIEKELSGLDDELKEQVVLKEFVNAVKGQRRYKVKKDKEK